LACKIDRGRLDDDVFASFAIDRQIDMTTGAALDFAHNPVAVEIHPRIKLRREGHF
jgi:hypothetical protein